MVNKHWSMLESDTTVRSEESSSVEYSEEFQIISRWF